MRCEVPMLLRCCFCFPLRFGLLVWAYIKQILCLLLLTLLIVKFHSDISGDTVRAGRYAISAVYIVFMIFENVFNVLFIVSAHTKDYKKMRIFYRYSIVVQFLNVALLCLFVGVYLYYLSLSPFVLIILWYIVGPALVLFLLLLIIQTYIIILVRSEYLKLKNNSQFEFVNPTSEEKMRTANIDFVKGIPDSV